MIFRWYDQLYTGSLSSWKVTRYRKKLDRGKLCKDGWLIILPNGSQNLLEITPAWLYKTPGYPFKEIYVVGLVKSKGEAIELIQEIVGKVYTETGAFDVAGWFCEKMNWDLNRVRGKGA